MKPVRTLSLVFVLLAARALGQGVREVQLSGWRQTLDFETPQLVVAPAAPGEGFHFGYFLYVPQGLADDSLGRLLVAPNNTGTTSDDDRVHRESAKREALRELRSVAEELRVALLVPTFPRPETDWRIYTHALDRDSMRLEEGPLARIDLQLLAMIEQASALLERSGVEVEPGVFLVGYSASGTFANRFAALHPRSVRAVVAGGLNGLPIYPLAELDGHTLPYPIGIADVEELTGRPFDGTAYARVSQFLYMGFLDRNDTFPYGDAWDDDERELIAAAAGETMMPDRWVRSLDVLETAGIAAQCVTYQATGHEIRREMWADIAAFLRANAGAEHKEIESHEYPFVPYAEIREGVVVGLYWTGDPNLPAGHRQLGPGVDFTIAIGNWLEGQSHQQLDVFRKNAGFEFVLCAEGHDDVTLSSENYAGNRSTGDGSFQAFDVRLSESQRSALEPGVPYEVHPGPARENGRWVVPETVVLVRPE